MNDEIQIQLVKLADGARLLRFSNQGTGLRLEKRLDPRQAVARQKTRLLHEFEELLSREVAATAH